MRLIYLPVLAVATLAGCARPEPAPAPSVSFRDSLPASPTGSAGYQGTGGQTIGGATGSVPTRPGDAAAYQSYGPGGSPVQSYVAPADTARGSQGYQPSRPGTR